MTGLPLAAGPGAHPVRLAVSLGASDYTSAEGLDDSIQLADQAGPHPYPAGTQ